MPANKRKYKGDPVMKHIVKRNNSVEAFDERKLYASIYTACLSVHEPIPNAELIADKVSGQISTWLAKRSEVTSNDIRKKAADFLKEINPHASYLYAHHRIIL